MVIPFNVINDFRKTKDILVIIENMAAATTGGVKTFDYRSMYYPGFNGYEGKVIVRAILKNHRGYVTGYILQAANTSGVKWFISAVGKYAEGNYSEATEENVVDRIDNVDELKDLVYITMINAKTRNQIDKEFEEMKKKYLRRSGPPATGRKRLKKKSKKTRKRRTRRRS